MKPAFSIFLLLIPCFLQAQVKNFVLPGFQWHEPTAWSPMGVPTANDSVTIHAETFIMPDSTARAKYVLVGPGGTLEIQRDVANNVPGILVIQNSPGIGFENEGFLEAGGRLTIKNTLLTPLFNKGTIDVLNRAKIIIDSTTLASGILNTGTITSDGLIDISKPKLYGIQNTFMMTFEDSAEVIIQGYESNSTFSGGINNSTLGAEVTNHGLIEIDGFNFTGIINAGQFDNFGELHLKNNRDTGFVNMGLFNNMVDGLVQVDSTTTGPGVYNGSTFINAGNLKITRTDEEGIINDDSLTIVTGGLIEIFDIRYASGITNLSDGIIHNHGTIHVMQIGSGNGVVNHGDFNNNGIVNLEEIYEDGITNHLHLNNNPGATIHILNTGDYAIESRQPGIIENRGRISVDSVVYGIYIQGQFHNYDSITFNIIGDYAIELFDTLINYSGGMINIIDGDGQTGFYVNGLCENYGLMSAFNIQHGINNRDHFLNEGEIILANAGSHGIDNGTGSLFTNLGIIQIDSTGDHGIDNKGLIINFDTISVYRSQRTGWMNRDTIVNEPGGYILVSDVQNTGHSGIQNGSSPIDQAFFNNKGAIRIDNINTYGLWNQADFTLAVTGDLQIMNTTETPIQVDSLSLFECLGTMTVQD